MLFSIASLTRAHPSIRIDSLLAQQDTTARRDTTSSPRDISLPAAFRNTLDSVSFLTSEQLHWIDYRFLGEILATTPGVYLRDQSSAGQYSQINIRGTDWRGIAVTADGRTINDPASGIYNLYYYTTDYLDRVEVITGPRAFLYGLNAAGGAVNLVSKHADSNRPFSKINYSESAHGYSNVDGSVSQNISGSLNVALGFQRQISDGRYPNSLYDAWNIRARVRYRLDDRISLILSEYLTSTNTQLNGGISPAELSDAFFPLEAQVRNEDSYEKLNRNDVDFSFVGSFFDDSASVTKLSFYYSNSFREYRDETGGDIPNALFIQSDHTSSWMGAVLAQRLSGKLHRLNIGSNIELRQIEGSPNLGRRRDVIGSVYGSEEFSPGERLTVAAFGRYDHYLNEDYVGIGGDATVKIPGNVSLFGGGSFSRRLPTYQELYWLDSTVSRTGTLVAEEHTHVELGTEIHFAETGFLRTAVFHKRIVNPLLTQPFGTGFVFPGVLFRNGDEIISKGVEARLRIRFWHMLVEGMGAYIFQESGGTTVEEIPDVAANAGIYFWDSLFDGHLHLKSGFRGTYQSSQLGTEFNPEVLSFVRNANAVIGAGGKVDFILIGRLGNAYIHFIWENLTDAQYFTTPFYPVLDRAIRFGVSWEFQN